MSYNGKINFGLVGDYDPMHDLDDLADDFAASLDELAAAAGCPHQDRAAAPRKHPRRSRVPERETTAFPKLDREPCARR